MKHKKINDEIFYYLNERALDDFYAEIFVGEEYSFNADTEAPFIIDCGSHYGLSIIYFKKRYPHSKILAFEPDPNNILILRKNIEVRELQGVEIIESAVSNRAGEAIFYGEIKADNSDSLGNSLMKSWGKRVDTDEITVKTVRLSDFIQTPVDFLKLNIEGAESMVMEDLFESKKISLINKIYLQYHQTKLENTEEQFDNLLRELNKNNFEIKVEEKELIKYLPAYLQPWVVQMNPSFKVLHCDKKFM